MHRVSLLQISLASCALAIGLPTALPAAEAVDNKALGFKMKLPDGFRSDANLLREGAREGVFAAYCRSDSYGRSATVICLRRIGKPLEEGPISLDQLHSYQLSATAHREKWKDFSINVVRYPKPINGIVLLDLVAHVPLKKEGVLIDIIGPTDDEDRLWELMRSTLRNFDGECNWPSRPAAAAAAPNSGSGAGALLFLLGFVIVFGFCLYVLCRSSSKDPHELLEFTLSRDEIESGNLPPICIVCGRKATGYRTEKFWWTLAWVRLFRYVGLLPYMILDCFFAKSMSGVIPHCDNHRSSTSPALKILWSAMIAVLVCGYVGVSWAGTHRFTEQMGMAVGIGIVLIVFSVYFLGVPHLQPSEITDRTISFQKLSREFWTDLREPQKSRPTAGGFEMHTAKYLPNYRI